MNPTIEENRRIALAFLKPTQAELDQGLKLHADSLVCDSYGFAPRAAIDGDRINALIEAGASDAELIDATEEMTMTRFVHVPIERAEYQAAWAAAGVTCIFHNAGVESQAPLEIMKRLARFTYAADGLRGMMARATQPDDIVD